VAAEESSGPNRLRVAPPSPSHPRVGAGATLVGSLDDIYICRSMARVGFGTDHPAGGPRPCDEVVGGRTGQLVLTDDPPRHASRIESRPGQCL
jgi:hypothetical protein